MKSSLYYFPYWFPGIITQIEGEVTSLSGADKREVVRVQGEVKIFL
jgi:hypothetical protein